MEQEVAQMESEDSGPVLQPVDKPEGSVELVKEDSTIPNPEDIGPTGDNTVTDSSIDTPIENQDETEGMEVDEPGPSLDGGLESVNNEENVSAVDNSEQGNVDNVENVSESNSANNNQEVLMEMDQELSDVPETVESGAETVEETESTNIENTNQTDEGNGANDLKESTDDVCDVATGVDDVNEQPETGSCIDTGNTDNADIEQFGTLNPAEEESERSNYSDNFKIENSNFGLNAAENDNGDNDNVADNQEQEEVDEGEEDNTECVEPESLVQDAIEEETESKEVENSKTEADDISYSKENASCNKDTPNINNDSEDVDQSNETVDENAGEILSDIKAQDDGLGNIEISSVRGAEDSNDDKDNDTKEDGDNKAIVGENDDGGDVESQVNPSQSEETTESVAEQIQENSNISTDVQQMEDPKSPTESIEIPEDEESQEMETDSSDKGIELAITSVEGNVAISNVEGNVGRSGDRQDSVESTEMDITENIDSDDNENVDNNDEDGEVQKEVVIDEDGADETSEAKTAENSTGDDNTDEITKNVTEDDIPVIKDVQTLSEAPSEEQTGDSFKSDADDVDKPKDEAEGSNDASADDGKESSNETVPNISEDSKDSNTAKETSDISNNVNDGPDNSRVSKDVETMETETGDSRDRNTSESLSEESGERKSSSPTDTSDAGVSMTSVKIKQERMENAEAADEGSSLKIADVTSTAGDDGKDSATVKKENFAKDEALITEQTTQTKDEGSKPTVEKKDDDVIAVKEEKKPTPKVKSSKIQTCIVCKKVVKCKYNIVRNGDVKHLCDDNCFKCFRTNPTTYLKQAEGKKEEAVPESLSQSSASPAAAGAKKPATQPTPITQQTGLKQYRSLITNSITNGNLDVKSALRSHIKQSQVYKTCTVCQLMNVHRTSKPFLNWLGLDFCGEECLGKFQNGLGTNCSYCSGAIFPNNKAKFCCRVGNDVKQFCSTNCNNDFIKRMKLCAYCNKDLTQVKDSFMAPVGNQGTFKDFCSQPCLQKFEEKNNKDVENGQEPAGEKTAVAPKGNFTCAVCSKVGPVKFEFKLDSKLNQLCSDPCASAFQYANKLSLNACDHCHTNMATDVQAPQYVQFEGQQKRFCSFMCVNNFMNVNKKIVLCGWCGNKKNNFDMIERVDANNKYQLFCSLNCLSLYRVNLQASSNQSVMCDQCRKYVPAQYHLTMSDASVRNFCSYGCVMHFQQQFQVKQPQPNAAAGKTVSQMLQAQKQQQTTTRSGRVVTKGAKLVEQPMATKKRKDSSDLIIQNVMSLAPQVPNKVAAKVTSIPASAQTQQQQQQFKQTTSVAGSQTVQQKIIIQPPPPVPMKNKSLLCKPITQTKATSCRPHTQTKEVQTDGKAEPEKLFVPVPVPIYCPTPLAMYSLPTPVIIPIPVPIPVPVFIPTTKKSANSILKQIKEIREKIPADPLEAELLMMAEAVAGKDEDSSSSSEEEDTTAPVPVVKETPSVTAASSGGGELGEDMLQMALRMASEMSDEPVMDLETSLEPVAVNTEPPPPPKPEIQPDPVEEDEEYIPARTRRSGRGGAAKRSSRSSTRRQPKRQKIEVQPVYREPTPSPPAPAAPPPDANFHLKYTYGVNAFKHWVIQKNSQLEQSAKPGQGKSLKTFKTDILQCTADELNYSLCLFVKEVRKPNGEEYAVDSIYYLCLGIQQYLFENGRIDNIFTDFYYERFTEGLNEILTRYEPKLNHAGQLVCRIEEEHLWESKQLGAHSPHVLLNSLVYFNTKYFMLKTSEDHLKLSFTHIMKHWKKTASGRGSGTGPNAGRSVYLRYYCPTPQGKVDNQKKKKEEMPVYEQTENIENPLRCPVKLYEFYLSKCPESIKSRNDTFYLQAERSSVPDSPVWYSNISVDGDRLAKLLNRIRLVREIQEAHLHTQPIYI